MVFEWDAGKNGQTKRSAVLLMVHAHREENENGEEVIRIVSAREADPLERRIYLEQAAD